MPATTSKGFRVAVVSVAFALIAASAVASGPPAAGQAAPALMVSSFGGALIDLNAMHGKVVVLNFWASWCEPCRREMPLLESLFHDYRDRVVVLGLSADDRHDRKDAVRAAQTVSYPTALLAEAQTNGFGMPAVLPLTYVIDASGRVNAVLRASQGALTDVQLHAAVDAALSASPGR
jgi:cytochrome c biogenesis protein CcmG, thiol:disulfide interchange protein DsbE